MSLKVVGGKSKDANPNVDLLIKDIQDSKLDALGFKDKELVLFSSDGLSLVETLGAFEAAKFYIMDQ